MTNLTDTQAILLSTASRRNDGSVLPLPTGIKPGGGVAKALAALLKRELIEERETNDVGDVHRTDGDLRYGLFVTPTGLDTIGVGPGEASATNAAAPASEADVAAALPAAPPAPKASTKTASVLMLLNRTDGATLPEIIAVTGWLPHTTRAALTGLRKKGHEIARGKRDGVTCYRTREQA